MHPTMIEHHSQAAAEFVPMLVSVICRAVGHVELSRGVSKTDTIPMVCSIVKQIENECRAQHDPSHTPRSREMVEESLELFKAQRGCHRWAALEFVIEAVWSELRTTVDEGRVESMD